MAYAINHPRLLCFACFLVLWMFAVVGARLRRPSTALESESKTLNTVLSSTLTLLALMIGFTFSMAISRYDGRKVYEEGEANAIGTEYLRADLMPADGAARTRALLLQYLDARTTFYQADYGPTLDAANDRTDQLQRQLWSAVKPLAATQPTPITALVVNGMNDVLNTQGYTQAAWWNRVPAAAWVLLIVIACFANLLVGYDARRSDGALLLVLPALIAVSFFLIADLDSPRGGLIRITPRNLLSLSQTLRHP